MDVRDVAEAQDSAAEYTPSTEGRFTVAAESRLLGELVSLHRVVAKDELLPPPKPFDGVVWRAENSKLNNVRA